MIPHLGKLVFLPAVSHIDSQLADQIKQAWGKFGFRKFIQPHKAHNGKLGYNWNLASKTYQISPPTKQFNSAYQKLVEVAKQVLPNSKFVEHTWNRPYKQPEFMVVTGNEALASVPDGIKGNPEFARPGE